METNENNLQDPTAENVTPRKGVVMRFFSWLREHIFDWWMLLLFIVLSNFSYSVSCILWILSVDHGFTQFCPLLSICAFCFGKFIFFVVFPYSLIGSVVQRFTTRWTNSILCFVELPFLAGFTLINVAFMSRLIAIT